MIPGQAGQAAAGQATLQLGGGGLGGGGRPRARRDGARNLWATCGEEGIGIGVHPPHHHVCAMVSAARPLVAWCVLRGRWCPPLPPAPPPPSHPHRSSLTAEKLASFVPSTSRPGRPVTSLPCERLWVRVVLLPTAGALAAERSGAPQSDSWRSMGTQGVEQARGSVTRDLRLSRRYTESCKTLPRWGG